MRPRRITLLLGCALLTAAASLPVGPASAGPVTVVSGRLELYDQLGSHLGGLPFNQTCSWGTDDMTVTGGVSGSISFDVEADQPVVVGTSNYRILVDLEASGTHSGGSASLTGDVLLQAIRTTDVGSCIPISGAGWCSIHGANIQLSGVLSGGTGTFSGANATFDDVVTGAASDCGLLIAADNGNLEVNNLVLS